MSSTINCVPVQPKTDCYYHKGNSFIHVSPVELPNIPLAKVWKEAPYFMNAKYAEIADRIANFQVRSDDVWVVSFPKCGTTWAQEMVRMLQIDLDYDKAAKVPLEKYSISIEGSSWYNVDSIDLIKIINNMPSPRLIKSHLPIQLLPKSFWTVQPKLVYISRNPKDAAVSFFHHYRNTQAYTGDIDAFMKVFLADETLAAPFYDHVLNYWYSRNETNILFLNYEQMKSDILTVLRKTQQFLGKSFSDQQLETLSQHLHVDVMRHNPSANNSLLLANIGQFAGVKITEP